MKIVIPITLLPDLVEEPAINPEGTGFDLTKAHLIVNEFDDHAIEQAILMKERQGGEVLVIAPDLSGADDALFTAAAKGADRIIKLAGMAEGGFDNHALAKAFALVIEEIQPDLIFTGVQGHTDLDGQIGPLIAGYLNLPYVGYIAGVAWDNGYVKARKEYPGGLRADYKVRIPAVLGVQAADEPPRYVAISKIRQAMNSAVIELKEPSPVSVSAGFKPAMLYQPEARERATMIEGDLETITSRLIQIMENVGAL